MCSGIGVGGDEPGAERGLDTAVEPLTADQAAGHCGWSGAVVERGDARRRWQSNDELGQIGHIAAVAVDESMESRLPGWLAARRSI